MKTRLDVSTTKIELARAQFEILLFIAAIGLASSACVGGGDLGDDSNEPSDGGDMLDGAAVDAGGSDGRIVGIVDLVGPTHRDGGAAGDAGPAGDGGADAAAPACDCDDERAPVRDVDGEWLPYCAADGAGLVEADGHACDDGGACVPATATRACGDACVPGNFLLSIDARCMD